MRLSKAPLLALLLGLAVPAFAAGTSAQLYMNPNCGCCGEYAKYLRAHGIAVTEIPVHNLAQMQEQNGVSERLAGCHIMKIGPYVFDGLIPVDSVQRVLAERPFIKGLTLPGMPAGAPGMPGPKRGPLHVYYISNDAPPKVYATY